jgi:hypothetical protein
MWRHGHTLSSYTFIFVPYSVTDWLSLQTLLHLPFLPKRYSPLWALASNKISLHYRQSLTIACPLYLNPLHHPSFHHLRCLPLYLSPSIVVGAICFDIWWSCILSTCPHSHCTLVWVFLKRLSVPSLHPKPHPAWLPKMRLFLTYMIRVSSVGIVTILLAAPPRTRY